MRITQAKSLENTWFSEDEIDKSEFCRQQPTFYKIKDAGNARKKPDDFLMKVVRFLNGLLIGDGGPHLAGITDRNFG